VKGAKVVITDNINPSKGVGNGIEGVLHSITFSPKLRKPLFQSILQQIKSASAGEVVVLDTAPMYVNIEFYAESEKKPDWSRKETVVPGKIVVPVPIARFSDTVKVDTGAGNETVYFRRHAFDLIILQLPTTRRVQHAEVLAL